MVEVLELRGQSLDQKRVREKYFAKLRRYLPKSAVILEVGSGSGAMCRAIAEFFGPEVHVCGLEPVDFFVKEAERLTPTSTYPNVSFRKGSATQLPFSAQTFDCVIFHTTLSHLSLRDRSVALQESQRVLKK